MNTTNFNKRKGWNLIHDDIENPNDLDRTLFLLLKTSELMEFFFKVSAPDNLEIHIDTSRTTPLNWANEPKISLSCQPTLWSQLIYQFAHEYCHRLIDSPFPSLNSLWFEEAICESSSRFFLKKMGITNLKDKILQKYKFNFIEYSNSLYNSNMETPWSTNQIFLNNDILKRLNIETTAPKRPYLNFLSTKITPIFSAHPDLWANVKDIRYFSNENSIQENIEIWQKRNSNIKEILTLLKSK
ncbi:hypothetical protein [Latilactobacillus curvatus]|uniref:hypothetical protein n=1 Tax=Latilactobacillus curvatus TaxID=28038 RepID=UPI000FECDA7C|nr:hypothetical protein [Latilactobacillus curvatus]QAR35370.1 hypothetical protein EQK21_04605 [Latilactobacillus curvatus]